MCNVCNVCNVCNAVIAISTWQAIPDLTEEELVAAFREADTSGNGTLDVEEGNRRNGLEHTTGGSLIRIRESDTRTLLWPWGSRSEPRAIHTSHPRGRRPGA